MIRSELTTSNLQRAQEPMWMQQRSNVTCRERDLSCQSRTLSKVLECSHKSPPNQGGSGRLLVGRGWQVHDDRLVATNCDFVSCEVVNRQSHEPIVSALGWECVLVRPS